MQCSRSILTAPGLQKNRYKKFPGSPPVETHLKFLKIFLGFCKVGNMSIVKYCFPCPFCYSYFLMEYSLLHYTPLHSTLSPYLIILPEQSQYTNLWSLLFIFPSLSSFLHLTFYHSLSVRVTLWKKEEPGCFNSVKKCTALPEGDGAK